jgi:hypothetical protein
MCSGNQFFRVRTRLTIFVFKAEASLIGLLVENATLGSQVTFSFFTSAVPNGACITFHILGFVIIAITTFPEECWPLWPLDKFFPSL